MCECRLIFITEVNILRTHEVRAIGRKFPRLDGSFAADFFGIRLMTAVFRALGTAETSQQRLYKSMRAGRSEEHFLKTRYGILSMGLGDEELLARLMAKDTSSSWMLSESKMR